MREIGDDVNTKGAMRFTPNAISSIQVAAEDFGLVFPGWSMPPEQH